MKHGILVASGKTLGEKKAEILHICYQLFSMVVAYKVTELLPNLVIKIGGLQIQLGKVKTVFPPTLIT